MATFISSFQSFPKELFRVNRGLQIRLRTWSPTRNVFDIHVQSGWVQPKALDPGSYRAPNGASMRPNSPCQHHLISKIFRTPDVIVYSVPSGTRLPAGLLLVHERTDHYSLQPSEAMTIKDLDLKLTEFFTNHARIFSRDEWLRAYQKPTEFLR